MRVHTHGDYSVPSLEHQGAGTMTCYPTQSHYPDTETTILIKPSARLGSDKYQFLTLLVLENVRSRHEPMTFKFPDLPEWEVDALLIRPPRLVSFLNIVTSLRVIPICFHPSVAAVWACLTMISTWNCWIAYYLEPQPYMFTR